LPLFNSSLNPFSFSPYLGAVVGRACGSSSSFIALPNRTTRWSYCQCSAPGVTGEDCNECCSRRLSQSSPVWTLSQWFKYCGYSYTRDNSSTFRLTSETSWTFINLEKCRNRSDLRRMWPQTNPPASRTSLLLQSRFWSGGWAIVVWFMTAFGSSTRNGQNIGEGVRHDSSRAEDRRVSEQQGTNRIKLSLLELQCLSKRWETSPLRCARWIEKKRCSVNLQDSRSTEWKKGDKSGTPTNIFHTGDCQIRI
jgi:hypothetical protein